MKILFFFSSVIALIIFSGCASTYNLEPSYDDKSHILAFDNNLSFTNTTLVTTKIIDAGLRQSISSKEYSIAGEDYAYPRILIYHKVNFSQNITARELVPELFLGTKKGFCDIEKIANLFFFECTTEAGVNSTTFPLTKSYTLPNYIIAEQYLQNGIFIRTNSFIFDEFKNHYKKIAISQGVKITTEKIER